MPASRRAPARAATPKSRAGSSADSLARYNRTRRPDAYARILAIDALNRASQASLRPLRDLRAAALGGLYGIAPVRRLMMRAGLGMR